MTKITSCPICQGSNLYKSMRVCSGGAYAPNYLPGLGSFLSPAMFNLITFEDCGFTGFFATSESRKKLSISDRWEKI